MRLEQRTLVLTFYLNPWAFHGFKIGDLGELSFSDCWRYRLGEQTMKGGGADSAGSVGAHLHGERFMKWQVTLD